MSEEATITDDTPTVTPSFYVTQNMANSAILRATREAESVDGLKQQIADLEAEVEDLESQLNDSSSGGV